MHDLVHVHNNHMRLKHVQIKTFEDIYEEYHSVNAFVKGQRMVGLTLVVTFT